MSVPCLNADLGPFLFLKFFKALTRHSRTHTHTHEITMPIEPDDPGWLQRHRETHDHAWCTQTLHLLQSHKCSCVKDFQSQISAEVAPKRGLRLLRYVKIPCCGGSRHVTQCCGLATGACPSTAHHGMPTALVPQGDSTVGVCQTQFNTNTNYDW